MEQIFKQEINFAQIVLYKNYSNISQKDSIYEPYPEIPKIKVTKNKDEDDIFLENLVFEEAESTIKKYITSAVTPTNVQGLKLYPKDHHHIFYTDIPKEHLLRFTNHADPNSPFVYYYPIKLVNAKLRGASRIVDRYSTEFFETTKDKQIKRHYNNPFAEIRVYKIQRWIKKEGDKVTIKLYISVRDRGVNKIYFTKRVQSTTLTFNIHSGNFNVINYQKNRKAQLKHFYTNSFTSLKQALGLIYNPNLKITATSMSKKIIEEFNNDVFHFAVKQTLGINEYLCPSGSSNDFLINDLMYVWTPKFVELKKIKLPDDSKRLLTNFYPTEKYLKKNNRKLIAAILDRFGIKSNITIKILHENTDLNLLSLYGLCRLLGKNYQKYIGNISKEFFMECTRNDNEDFFIKNSILEKGNIVNHFFEMENIERENIVKIINDYIKNSSDSFQNRNGKVHSLIPMFSDHFRMLKRIKEYYPELRLRSRTYKAFYAEHTELSKIERALRNEFSIHYIFDEEMIDAIEKPIEIVRLGELPPPDQTFVDFANTWSEVFTPKILKTTEDYLEEGEYMHHCVGGYINQESSIIISLRYKEERVTCEFDSKTRRCIQAQYFTNDPYPSYYETPLTELKERVSRFSGKFGSIEKIKERLKINGKEVKVEEVF